MGSSREAACAGRALRTPVAPAAAGERRRERVAYWAYRGAEWGLQRLPRRVVLGAAAAVATAVYHAAPGKRRLTRENLARAVGGRPRDRRVDRAARRAFRNYARYLVDMMRLGSLRPDAVEELVRIDNLEALTEARAEGRGVLLCCVHFGGMDMIGPALKRHGQRIQVVADDTSYGRLFDHLRAVRALHEIHLIPWRNLRGLFRALRAGENVVLFCDWGYRRGDVPVEFFGEATTFPAGPATMSAKSGAPMLPVDVRRTKRDTFVARGLPLVRAASAEPAELFRATQQLADALASVIAADPGQWYIFRDIWPRTAEERRAARRALEAARRGDDWARPDPA